jgi:hypothetical protein
MAKERMDKDEAARWKLAHWVLQRHHDTGGWPTLLEFYEEALRLGLSPNETEAVKQERAAQGSALPGG